MRNRIIEICEIFGINNILIDSMNELFGLALDSHFAAARTAIDSLGGPLPVAATPGADATDPEQREDATRYRGEIVLNI